MRVTTEMKTKVNAKVAECCRIASESFNRFFDMPRIEYKNLGKRGGTAFPGANILKVHSIFLMEYDNVYIDKTIVHEMAHIIVGQV